MGLSSRNQLTILIVAVLIVLTAIVLAGFFLPVRAAIILSAVLLVLLALFVYWFETQIWDRAPDPERAAAIATYFWRQLSSLPGVEGARVGRVSPLFDLDGKPSSLYDVKFGGLDDASRGYAVVSTSRRSFPILEFATKGPSLVEQLAKLAPGGEVYPVWLTPTYAIALAPDGEIVARLGDYVASDELQEKYTFDDMGQRAFHELVWAQRIDLMHRTKEAVKDAWGELLAGGKKTSDLVKDSPPSGLYADLAEGHDRAPLLKQIPKKTGANSSGHTAGCGPVAWATLIGWHDLLWTSELLRGSQDANGKMWGPGSAVDPRTELKWNCHIDRVIMKLHDRLDTYGNDGVGWTKDSKMKRGFGYVKNSLGHAVSGKHEDSGFFTGNLLQQVYLRINVDDRPVLIKTPGHFSVAGGVLVHPTSNKAKKQWLYINTGWGSWKYIRSDYLEGLWYVKDILPRTKTTYPATSSVGPTLLTTYSGATELFDTLWVFWLGDDGDLHYAKGTEGDLPDLTNSTKMNVSAVFEPAVSAYGGDIYLAYVTPDRTIHLKRWSAKYERWKNIPFPESIHTKVRPAICGHLGNWLTVAFSDEHYGVQMIGTNNRMDQAHFWPDDILSPQLGTFWNQVDFVGTSHGLSLVRRGLITCLIKRHSPYSSQPQSIFRIGSFDGSDQDYHFVSFARRTTGGCGQVLSNNTLFTVNRSDSDRILIGTYVAGHWGVSWNEAAFLTETCIGDPSLAALEREGGDHPTIVLGWTGTDAGHSLNLRTLSLDTDLSPISYAGTP